MRLGVRSVPAVRAAPQSVYTMLSISTQFAAYAPAAQPLVQARASVVMESKASLEALAKELSRIANAPAMALYAEIKQRLTGFAGRVRAAAPALPDAL